MVSLYKNVKRFFSDESGNFAIIFAISLTVLLLIIGAAIDYSGMVSKRMKLQQLSDAAVLAAVTSDLETQEEMKTFVNLLAADMGWPPSTTVTAELTENNTVIVEASAPYNMLIMNAFGSKSKDISATAEAPLGGAVKVNFSLVLDTTASMAEGGRMTALKEAADILMTELEKSNTGGSENVKVSLVPFADYVRISPDNKNEHWIELQPDQNVSWKVLDGDNSVGCKQVGEGETATTECDKYVYKDENQDLVWIGCMGSRLDGYNKIADYSGKKLQGFVAHGTCTGQNSILQPLTTDLSSIKASIQSLTATGSTYLPAGLVWGWRTLDNSAPFPVISKGDKKDTRNILLLMTDGNNTLKMQGTKPDFNGMYHWKVAGEEKETQEAANVVTSELCTSIKIDGIQIISIAFEVTDPSTKTLLKNCASSSQDFYDATNANQLNQAFKDIGSSLNTIRLMR